MADKFSLDHDYGVTTIVGPNGELKAGTPKDLEEAELSRAAQKAFEAGDRASYDRLMAQVFQGWKPNRESPAP